MTVLGDVGDAGADHRAGVVARHVLPADDDLARLDGPQAGDRLDQLALAVALHAGQRDDLAGVDGQLGAPHGGQVAVVADVHVAQLEHRLTRMPGRLVDL